MKTLNCFACGYPLPATEDARVAAWQMNGGQIEREEIEKVWREWNPALLDEAWSDICDRVLLEAEASPAKKSTQLVGARLVRVVRDRTRDYALRQIVQRVERKPDLQPADLRLALTGRISEGVPAAVLARRGVETPKQLERKVATYSAAELRGLLVELSLTAWLDDEEDVTGARLKVACKANGLDHREIETTVRELLAKEENLGRAEALFTKTR